MSGHHPWPPPSNRRRALEDLGRRIVVANREITGPTKRFAAALVKSLRTSDERKTDG